MSVKHLAKGSRQPPLQKGKLRLYTMRFCPFAQRVHLVLDAKKIPYDSVFINLTYKPEWLLEKNPVGKVPLLELDNGQYLYESLIVSDYLDEKYPQRPLYPKDPFRKAKDRLLIEQFGAVINTMVKVMLNTDKHFMDDHEQVIMQGLETFDQELANRGTTFFGGQEPSMLDYMVWPWCERADLLPLVGGNQFIMKKDRYKHLMEWRNAMRDDPAVKCSILDTEVHIKYLQSRRAGIPDYDILT
ncbi:sepia [Carabus blaptoides fortunei]